MLGSYPYPPSLIIRQTTEPIIIVKKTGTRERPSDKTDSKISIETWNKCANDVWTIAPESARKIGHSAPFPVELPARLITIHSFINEIVLDPFMGSGTTARACMNLKRNFIGIENKPDYCKIAEERLAQGVL
jgi:site-specific DNA-methyltransferase (adenine-specific)